MFRALQPVGLTPMSGKGGRSAAKHWNATHLISHMIGMAVAQPATAAPQVVPFYRDMTINKAPPADSVAPGARAMAGIIEDGGSFGHTLDRMLEEIVSSKEAGHEILVTAPRLILEFNSPLPFAELQYSETIGEDVSKRRRRHVIYAESQADLLRRWKDQEADPNAPAVMSCMTFRVTIETPLFMALAGLLADTLRHEATLPRRTSSGGLFPPETENAAPDGTALPIADLLDPAKGAQAHNDSGLDNHDHTARVCPSSRGFESGQTRQPPWNPSHDRATRLHSLA